MRGAENPASRQPWVYYYDSLAIDSPACLPVPDLVAYLRRAGQITDHIADFLSQCVLALLHAPIFQGPDNWGSPWTLAELPELPPAKAMIEFVPTGPWLFELNQYEDEEAAIDKHFLIWREAIRPAAEAIERANGEPVYYFADLGNELDDDDVHRFLVLHRRCDFQPESNYVRYLVGASGARDVEELKAALINPQCYAHPYEMNEARIGLEALSCRFRYLPPGLKRTVTVVFATPSARVWAEALLLQKIGAQAYIVAPQALVTEEWVNQATQNNRGWTLHYMREGTLADPLHVLAHSDELCVVANEKTLGKGFDLALSDSIEELLWMALQLPLEAGYFSIDGYRLGNPEICLEKRGVPQRVESKRQRRQRFMAELPEIRLDCDYGASGIWKGKGQMLGYDHIELPFPLLKRLASWQGDFDATVWPPGTDDELWLETHSREEEELARAIQVEVASGTLVKIHRHDQWLAINEWEQSREKTIP